jgi:hypothetical protein
MKFSFFVLGFLPSPVWAQDKGEIAHRQKEFVCRAQGQIERPAEIIGWPGEHNRGP